MSHSNSSGNEPSKQQPGGPTAAEQSKAAGLPVNQRDEQTEERLEQAAQDAPQRNPNRNLDKPDIHKPTYGGGH